MKDPTLNRLRVSLQDVRRTVEWKFIRQIATASMSEGEEAIADVRRVLKEELAYVVEQEMTAAAERTR